MQQCGRAGRDGDEAECVAFIKADKDREGPCLVIVPE